MRIRMSRSLEPPPAETPEEILLYPAEDGIPLESENHRRGMSELIDAARDRCEERDIPILAGGNLFIYYVEGNPKKSVGPDFFVARDLSSVPPRRVFKVWTEGKMPELVVELASPSTARNDLGPKKDLYESLGVVEYIVFDGEEIGWDPPMVAFRRRGDRLEEESVWRPDGTFAFYSDVLELEFRPRGRVSPALRSRGRGVRTDAQGASRGRAGTRGRRAGARGRGAGTRGR